MTINVDIEQLNRINFRNCLDAMSRPGDIFQLTPVADSSIIAMATMLLYSEVTFYQQMPADWSMVKALTNSAETTAQEADYLFFTPAHTDVLQDAKTGNQQNPESSATLLCYCGDQSIQTQVNLSGPGIDKVKHATLPVPVGFLSQLADKNRHFPLGVDTYFITSNSSSTKEIWSLPRTTRVEIL